ncbi:MAG: CoA transferase [Chloroflexi bacterium]|nr:CoA transferase [Chloroflexota bacterium]
MQTALNGIKVLELGDRIAGPYCTKILADYGADVIKVETPGLGDPIRSVGPFPDDKPELETSGLFLYLNTNKKSITLNLRSPTGVKIFKDLVKTTDAVIENFNQRLMTCLGLDYEILKDTNPHLVMSSISSFGRTGPYRDYKSTDLTVWALSGILYETGDPDREPLKIGSNETECVAGLYGVLTVLAALYYRDGTGVGQYVDVSAWEAFHTTQPYMILIYSQLGVVKKRVGLKWPWGLLPCRDGHVGFFFGTQANWESLCALLGMPELRDKPGYQSPLERDEHREEITSIIASWLKDRCVEEVFHAAQELRLPLTPAPDMSQIIDMPQHKTRGYFVDIDHPMAGKLTYPGALFKLSETPWRAGRAPLLGEHNKEIYCDRLGYSKRDLVSLREQGVI